MNKPFNPEIIKLMAAHSDGAAAYASAMKWDWLRRQKVGDITKTDLQADCGFCDRFDGYKCQINDNCLLKQKDGGKICRKKL